MSAVKPFRNHLPVKIRFGEGVAADLAAVVAEEGAAHPLIVIDEGLAGLVPRPRYRCAASRAQRSQNPKVQQSFHLYLSLSSVLRVCSNRHGNAEKEKGPRRAATRRVGLRIVRGGGRGRGWRSACPVLASRSSAGPPG